MRGCKSSRVGRTGNHDRIHGGVGESLRLAADRGAVAAGQPLCRGAVGIDALIASQLDSKDPVHDNLLQTTVNGCEGDRRGATSISGPDDPKGMRCCANGRSVQKSEQTGT